MFTFSKQATIIALLMSALASASAATIPDGLIIARSVEIGDSTFTWYALSPEAQAEAAVKRVATYNTSSSQAITSRTSCGNKWNQPDEIVCDPYPKDVAKGYRYVCDHLVGNLTVSTSQLGGMYYGVPIPEAYRVLCLAEDVHANKHVGKEICCLGWNGSVKNATYDKVANSAGYNILIYCPGDEYISGYQTAVRFGDTCTEACMFGDFDRADLDRPCDYKK